MAYRVDEVGGEPDREDLVAFLSGFEGDGGGAPFWRARLRMWWEGNPAFDGRAPRGWTLVVGGRIVGFLGAIPARYVCRGEDVAALAATTWRVEREHRAGSMALFLRFAALGSGRLLLDTTPTREVADLLRAMRYRRAEPCVTYYLPMRQPGGWGPRFVLDPIARLLPGAPGFHPETVVSIDDPFAVPPPAGGPTLRRLVDRAYLDWYCRSPVLRKDFVGVRAEDGSLSSYIVVTAMHHRRVRKCRVIDHGTWRPDGGEVVALVHHVCRHRELLRHSGDPHLLTFTRPANQPLRPGLRGLRWKRTYAPNSYYRPPSGFEGVEKPYCMAEGDFGC